MQTELLTRRNIWENHSECRGKNTDTKPMIKKKVICIGGRKGREQSKYNRTVFTDIAQTFLVLRK